LLAKNFSKVVIAKNRNRKNYNKQEILRFAVLNTGIPVLRKCMLKNMQKIPFGEGQVQDPIPALPGHGSKIPAVLLGDR
jgi:hypothetical protein